MDKISWLSLEEVLSADKPIVEITVLYYLISNKIVRRYKEIIVS